MPGKSLNGIKNPNVTCSEKKKEKSPNLDLEAAPKRFTCLLANTFLQSRITVLFLLYARHLEFNLGKYGSLLSVAASFSRVLQQL